MIISFTALPNDVNDNSLESDQSQQRVVLLFPSPSAAHFAEGYANWKSTTNKARLRHSMQSEGSLDFLIRFILAQTIYRPNGSWNPTYHRDLEDKTNYRGNSRPIVKNWAHGNNIAKIRRKIISPV